MIRSRRQVVRFAVQPVRFHFGVSLYDEIHRSSGDRRLFVMCEQRVRGRRYPRGGRAGAGGASSSGGGGGSDRGPVHFVFQQYFDDGMGQDRSHAGHLRRRHRMTCRRHRRRRRWRPDGRRLFALRCRVPSGVRERRHVRRHDGAGGVLLQQRRGPLIRRGREHGQRGLGHRVMITSGRHGNDLRSFVRVLRVDGRFFFREIRQEEPAVVVDHGV